MKYSSRYTIKVHGSKTDLIGPISTISFLWDTDEHEHGMCFSLERRAWGVEP